MDQSTMAPSGSGLARQSPLITRNSAPFEEGGIRAIPASPLASSLSLRSEKKRAPPSPIRTFSLSPLPFNVSQCILALLHSSIRQTSSPSFLSFSHCGMLTVSLTARPPALTCGFAPFFVAVFLFFLRPWPRIFAFTDRPPSSALSWLAALSVFITRASTEVGLARLGQPRSRYNCGGVAIGSSDRDFGRKRKSKRKKSAAAASWAKSAANVSRDTFLRNRPLPSLALFFSLPHSLLLSRPAALSLASVPSSATEGAGMRALPHAASLVVHYSPRILFSFFFF